MAVRSKDIAEKLGVSTATVSLVLNGKPGISDKTRARVIQQINELGYGYLIQGQAAEENKTVSFVIFKNKGELLGMNSFFPLILEGIEMTAREYGYSLTIINVERGEIEKQINYISESNCAGYVIFATEMQDEDMIYFEKLGIPFVLFDNYFVDRRINCVKVNNEQGIYLSVKYLYDMGHRKIGYLGSGLQINSFLERKKYAIDIIKSLGLEFHEEYTHEIGYPSEMAEKGMEKVLDAYRKEELPTAFLTDNDLVAVGAMQAMKKKHYRIPEDFSIIGYDDRPICTMTEPKLTTIQLPRNRFGAEAVEQLIRSIKRNENSYTKVEINGELIKRETVKRI